MGDNYVWDDVIGRQCHSKRTVLERNLAATGLTFVKRQPYRAFATSDLGRVVSKTWGALLGG